MAKLIIIRGNSGSGKTTVAKSLQEKFGNDTMLISQDVVRRDMLKAKDGMDTTALPLFKTLLSYGGEHCEVVILEGILNAKWYAPLFWLAVELFKDNIFAYYYDIDFKETVKRHKSKPGADFGEEDMRKWWNEKDYIGCIKEKNIDAKMSVLDTVEMIYDDVVFLPTDELKSDEIYLKLDEKKAAIPEKGFVPAYLFKICLLDGTEVGRCDFRIGYNEGLYYGGNIGYGVHEKYRGNHYAAKACKLLFHLAQKHDMKYVYISCNPDNYASKRTCEGLGGLLEKIADLPEDNDMYIMGDRQKCIFRFDLY